MWRLFYIGKLFMAGPYGGQVVVGGGVRSQPPILADLLHYLVSVVGVPINLAEASAGNDQAVDLTHPKGMKQKTVCQV